MIRKQTKLLIYAALAMLLCVGKAFCQQGTYFTTPEAKKCSEVIKDDVEKGELPYVEKNQSLSGNSCSMAGCRHGKTECNNKKIVQGVGIDDEIIEPKERFIDYVAWLKTIDFNPSVIYTSPLKRAIQTGEGIKEALGTKIPSRQDKKLTDVDYGDLEKKPIKEVTDTPSFKEMYLDIKKSAPGSKDTYAKRIIEMYQAINSIAEDNPGEKVILIGSQYPLNLFFSLINGEFYTNVPNFSKIVMNVVPGKCCDRHPNFPVKNCKHCKPMQVTIKNYDKR